MDRWKESQLKQLSCATDLDTAYKIALEFANYIGFKFFAFSMTYQARNHELGMIQRNNYPMNWNKVHEQKKLKAIDPIVAQCNHSIHPILWTEQLFSKVPSLWEVLEVLGIQHGWSQSMHTAESGLCSILSFSRTGGPVTPYELYENLGFTALMGQHLHALVAKSLPKKAAKITGPRLSDREIDVLTLAAAGKTADESARILSLSPRTIHFHMQNTIEKFGVHNKISAIIAAIKAGYLPGAKAPG